jgi:hypothetical protein
MLRLQLFADRHLLLRRLVFLVRSFEILDLVIVKGPSFAAAPLGIPRTFL